MKLGMTYDERCNPKHVFVWFPMKLEDGSWVWLERVVRTGTVIRGNCLGQYSVRYTYMRRWAR